MSTYRLIRRTFRPVGVAGAVIAALMTQACTGEVVPRTGPAAPTQFNSIFPEVSRVTLHPSATDPIGKVGTLVKWRDRLVIVDPLQANLKAFDRQGRLLQTIGQAGSGPGEFRRPFTAAAVAEGRLAVLDVPRMYLSLFSPDGTFERGWLIEAMTPGQMTAIEGGKQLLIPALRTELRGDVTMALPEAKSLHVYDLDGKLRRSLATISPAVDGESTFFTITGTIVGGTAVAVPFSRNEVHHVDLQTGREWDAAVGTQIYVPPAWQRARFRSIAALNEWANQQMWARRIVAIDSSHYVVKFFTLVEGKTLYHYAVASTDGKTLAVSEPTPWDLHLFENGVGYATRTDEEGNVAVAMLRTQLPGSTVRGLAARR